MDKFFDGPEWEEVILITDDDEKGELEPLPVDDEDFEE